jgi:hypothetical protein
MAVSRDELVQTIVGLLKPWVDPYQQRDVIAGVNEQIGEFEAALPELSREGVIATRECARKILRKVTGMQRQLDASPEMRARLSPMLDNIKRECEAAIKGTLTERGGGNDQVKEWCARKAWVLVIRFSKSRPTSGSADSPFRHIAGLLCNIIEPTEGDDVPDLERPCEAVLKKMALVQNSPKNPA